MWKKTETDEKPSGTAGPGSNTADFMSLFHELVPHYLPNDQDARDATLWLNLAHMGNQWARALSTGNVFGMTELGLGLVMSLLDIEQAQMRALRSIDENVRLLMDGPANTGRILLKQAELAEGPERAEELVNDANKKFFDALPLAADPREAVVVKMHLGVTALLLRHRDEAQRWLNEAYRDVGLEVVSLAQRSGNVKVFESKKDWAWFGAFGYGFVIFKKLKNRKRSGEGSDSDANLSFSEKSEDALRELIPVVHCLAVIHNAALSDEDTKRLPALKLKPAGKKSFQLVQVEATIDN
jgi:hypothetical protein